MERFNNLKLALAPMAGITDKAFRQICRKYGADITWSEMVSAEGLIRQPIKNNKSLILAEKFSTEEKNYWVQIFGHNPASMAKAARIIEREIKPNGIDINLGCPVPKAKKSGYGACQIENIPEVVKIIKEVKKVIHLPLSAKTRVGIKNPKEILKFSPQLEKAGLSQLVVHARTLKGMFSEKPHWKIVKKLNERLNIPIIYNGGIKTPEDACFYQKKTKCPILMIGQAAIGYPWIFREIKNYSNHKKIPALSQGEIAEVILEHAKLNEKYYGKRGVIAFRKHFSAYLKNIPQASYWRSRAVNANSIEDIKNILKKYLKNPI